MSGDLNSRLSNAIAALASHGAIHPDDLRLADVGITRAEARILARVLWECAGEMRARGDVLGGLAAEVFRARVDEAAY